MSGKIRWLGVAFVEFITAEGQVILFDPWTKTDGNPTCPYETTDFTRADLLLVSHDHFDHIGSAAALCRQTGGLVGGPDETMKRLMAEEGLQPENIVNHGGGYLTGGGTKLPYAQVIAVPANHTSRTSVPMGTIVKTSDGTTIYHAGDTALTGEMEIYARLYPLDVAILPIFGLATMDALQATEAVRLMKPRKVLPIHFDFCAEPQVVLDEFMRLSAERTPWVEVLSPVPGQYHPL